MTSVTWRHQASQRLGQDGSVRDGRLGGRQEGRVGTTDDGVPQSSQVYYLPRVTSLEFFPDDDASLTSDTTSQTAAKNKERSIALASA
jgi:hypothetical protein